ncbi:MAG: hypothetical protein DI533_21725 [Cereibacter sphaeroides]|uniref:Calcineurin-like phosphoesterase domain-containing protein n=1 Tax=Cereibacter sphaeroides TaxID=1063 RepID=A0A2W5S3N5_CERSP|nr:MAG: hypothetical protein DI533_21725 [Cereibacter sphaeroides]
MHVTERSFEIGFVCDPSEELIAIGDIHGYADLLDELLDQIAKISPVPGRVRTVVLLGDLIDRGSQSLRALDLAIGAAERLGCVVVGLLGNHEQFLRVALEEIDGISDLAAATWVRNGGGAVIQELAAEFPGKDLDVPTALGAARLMWLKSLQSHYESGDVIAVHAGLNPTISRAEFLSQNWLVNFRMLDEDAHWAWVREPFLDHTPAPGAGHHGMFVVHGHSPPHYEPAQLEEQVRRARVNLDGGSYSTGRARMLRIVGHQATLFEAVA